MRNVAMVKMLAIESSVALPRRRKARAFHMCESRDPAALGCSRCSFDGRSGSRYRPIAWLDGEEPVLSRVEDLLVDRPVVSWINLVEVYYRVARDQGEPRLTRRWRTCGLRSRWTFQGQPG
jgi:hypothetical protein